jgi:hypothetical protein
VFVEVDGGGDSIVSDVDEPGTGAMTVRWNRAGTERSEEAGGRMRRAEEERERKDSRLEAQKASEAGTATNGLTDLDARLPGMPPRRALVPIRTSD